MCGQSNLIVLYLTKSGFDHTSLSFFLKKLKEVLGICRPVAAVATGALSLVVERSGHEADHSPPPSVEVKNEPGYTSILPTGLHGLHRITLTHWRSAGLAVAGGVLRLTATDF